MKYFTLPDLGEGLQEAEIVEWHIAVGDTVQVDQLIVSVETAKAIVDVPSPQAGIIAALFGNVGDILHTNEPLIEYKGEIQSDTGTVVGVLAESAAHDEEDSKLAITRSANSKTQSQEVGAEVDHFIIGSAQGISSQGNGAQSNSSQSGDTQGGNAQRSFATPAIRALAKRLHVDINTVTGTGHHHLITTGDVEKNHQIEKDYGAEIPLRGVQRAMAKTMTKAQHEVAKVTICDEVDIHKWYGNNKDNSKDKRKDNNTKVDPTMRLVQAIGVACKAEPRLNAWFNGDNLSMRILDKVNLGIAVDTEDGLFVPVLQDINNRDLDNLKQGIDALRSAIKSRKIPPREMTGATITLSNFGTIAGKYGNPVVVPPMVAILGAGTIHQAVVPYQGEIVIHPIMPLSFSFDHRAITGGEAARFLKAVIDDLTDN